jgi:hypothetical protein
MPTLALALLTRRFGAAARIYEAGPLRDLDHMVIQNLG